MLRHSKLVICLAFAITFLIMTGCFALQRPSSDDSPLQPITVFGGIPALDEQTVLDEFDQVVYVGEPECDITWVKSSAFHTDSTSVEMLGDLSQDTIQVNVTVKQSNDSFESTRVYCCVFVYEYEEWEIVDYWIESDEVVPTEGVDTDCVLENIYSILNWADDGEHTFADGSTCRLVDLYSSGVFAVTQNKTGKNGGSVEISVKNSNGFSRYEGIITADYSWDAWDHVWGCTCNASESCYKTNLEEMLGTWQGEYIDTGDTNKKCYAGRYSPFEMTVKSADSLSGTVVADISFLAHCHFAEQNAVQTTDGDTIYTIKDVLISVPSQTGQKLTIYEYSQFEKDVIYESYWVNLTFEDDGSIDALVHYRWMDSGSEFVWGSSTYEDVFKLAKVVEE